MGRGNLDRYCYFHEKQFFYSSPRQQTRKKRSKNRKTSTWLKRDIAVASGYPRYGGTRIEANICLLLRGKLFSSTGGMQHVPVSLTFPPYNKLQHGQYRLYAVDREPKIFYRKKPDDADDGPIRGKWKFAISGVSQARESNAVHPCP